MPKDNVAQENISVNLPVDCIYEIIQYVIHDVKTLHSCIALNQMFCQITIQILWRNPFKYTQDETKKSLIFRTYFSCLDNHEKEQITTFFNKSISDFPKPFINYPSFLQEFEIYEIQKSMRSFLRQYYSVSPTENRINSIVRVLNPFIGRLLFNKQNNIKYLNVELNGFQMSIEKNQIDMSSFGNETLSQVLSNINKFSFGFGFKLDIKKLGLLKFIQRNAAILTDVISQHNKGIQHVRFSFTSLYMRKNTLQKLNSLNAEYDKLLEILNSFILSLNNLRSLETPCFKDLHSNTLNYLKLYEITDCSIIIDILDHCPNLETIELVSFYFDNLTSVYSISIFDKPIVSNLNHLKNLYIVVPYPSVLKLFERIVLMSNNNNLRTLFYGKQDSYHFRNDGGNNHNIIPSIQTFCTNLTHLSIKVANKRDFSSTVLFLSHLQNLVHLKLSCSDLLKNDDTAKLARSFSPSLQILEFDSNSIMMTEDLRVLLQNVRCNLKELSIIDTRIIINDTILRIVIDYARKKNSLMIFRYLKPFSYYYQFSSQVFEEARELFTIDDNPAPFMKSFIKSTF